ncbi:hypothetical protein ABLN72_04725 [Mycobacterium tuberculosis]
MKRFRVFRAPLQASQHFHCFRIYRETLSRFSCAASGRKRKSPAETGVTRLAQPRGRKTEP